MKHVTKFQLNQTIHRKVKNNNCLNELNEMKFCEVSRKVISNWCWNFQLSILKNKKVLFLKKIFFKPYHQDRSKRWCLLSKFSVKVLAESMAESPESLLTHKKKIVWSDLHCSLQIFETNRLIIKLTTWAAQSSYYCMLSMFISIFLDVTHNLLMHSYNIFFSFFR